MWYLYFCYNGNLFKMLKLLSYPLTIIYYFLFGLTLLVFHPILWLSNTFFGYSGLKRFSDLLQLCQMRCLNVLGVRFTFTNHNKINTNQPIIIIANHQGANDISPIMWHMRKYHPKFISKKELGTGIPSISYGLRHGGSLLIDRKKPIETIKAIKTFGAYLNKEKYAAVIFPEGSRSKNGTPKKFQSFGLLTLFKEMPLAIVIPITINDSWKTTYNGNFPMGLGAHITFMVHEPLKVADFEDKNKLINNIETTIKNHIRL